MGLFKVSKRMEKSMNTFGFIGMGNMGYAMLKGALNSFSKEDIIFTCPSSDRREKISEETGVRFAESNAECANNAKYIILAVKPQVYDVVLKNIENVITSEKVIISIAPGITIDSIKGKLGGSVRVVRAMPNTPALVGEGMTGISYNKEEFTIEERDTIEQFFQSFGEVVTVPEHLMSAVVCASGSSPAYAYMFIEALADSVVKYGIYKLIFIYNIHSFYKVLICDRQCITLIVVNIFFALLCIYRSFCSFF